MNGFMTKAVLGATLAATALTATAAPAEAQRYRGGYYGHGYHHHGDATGAAVAGGIVGLALGAAIASSDRPRYYDRGYSYDRYYRGPAYVERDYYYDGPRCHFERRYDPYYGYPTRVRVCY